MILETSRLILRRWRPDDAARVASIYAKPDVMQFIPGGVWNAQRTRELVERMRDLDKQVGYSFYPIVLKDGGHIIGHCGLGRLENGPEVEVAYVLDSPYWRRGYATEAAGAMIGYGFARGFSDRFVAVAFPENARSIAVMQKIGMTRAGPAQHFGRNVEKYEIFRSRT